MPPVSVCGRFDNAPAHTIIISTRFATGELGTVHSENEKPRGSRKDQEARRIEKANAAIIKADLKKAREAIERLQKMEMMRRHEAKAKRAKAKDWRPGESKDQRKRRRATEARQAAEAAKIAALPAGYVPIKSIELPVCYDVARNALSKRHVHGVKIGQTWYTSGPVLLAYFAQRKARHLASLKQNRKRGTR